LGLEKGDRFIPADIKIHKEKIFEDYKIKYLSFQSLPGFYVTCNLYEPLKPSPEGLYPAVVMLCGHSMEKSKAYDCYQKACLGLVKLGFVVLIFDPMGQGERNYPGNEHSENIRGSLIGLSAYGMMVRDAMCAINYLKTCKNVDKSRIGLTGTSGGGGNTFYSALLSQDIAAAFISSYVCGYYDFVATGWGHCNCSYIPGVGACFDQWEILAASCPRPLMVHAGPEDYAFPFKGTKKQVELASAHYKEKGFSGKMRFYLATEYDLEKKRHDKSWLGHGFVLPAREAMYGWFCKCLKGDGDGSPIPEPPMKGKTKEELDVYPKGLPRDKVSFRNIIAKRSDGLARKHLTLTNVKKWKKEASDLRREIKKLLSVDINDPRKGTIKEVVPFGNNIIGEKILFASESSVPCSGIMYKNKKNKNKKSPVVFVLAPIKSLPFPNNFIESLLEKNIAVFVFEPRGFGETCLNHLAMKWLPPGHKKKIGAGLVENVALLLGKPILPQRVGDLLMALKYLEGRKDIDLSRISMSCDGPESSLIASFAIPYCKNDILLLFSEPILSYRKYLHARQGFFCASNILPGIYNIADLANVIALHAPNPLCIIRSGKGSKEEITYIRNVYSMLSASENFISLSQKKDRCKIILQYFNRNR
jgi:dienelactone hydrolase